MVSKSDMVALAKRWIELYNEDHVQLVNELYTDDLEARAMGLPFVLLGKENLLAAASKSHTTAPNRRLRADDIHTAADVIVIEATLLDPDQGRDWESPCCVVLSLRGGLVKSERIYLDVTKWPGMAGIIGNTPPGTAL